MIEINRIIELFDFPQDNKVLQLTELDLSYIAGIVDGEGCISIVKSRDCYQARLSIKMCDNIIIPWLSNKLGKSYNIQDNKLKGVKDSYHLNICGKYGVGLVIKIFPYLKLKRNQAENFIRLVYLQSFTTQKGKIIGESYRIYKEQEEELFIATKILNNRNNKSILSV